MPRIYDYKCSCCGKPEKRDRLTVKKAVFQAMGRGAKISKTRTSAWLCPTCLVKDIDWKRESYETITEVGNAKAG